MRPMLWRSAVVLVAAGLGWFYYAGAAMHARTVNLSKARGDQSAYLGEAKLLYENWNGRHQPPVLYPRNRMPLYPAFLAALYDPSWSDDEFFERAKRQSIVLSLGLLACIGLIAWQTLPPLAACNVVLVLAFGSYVFRAGYTQSELLFYTLFFAAFVAMWKPLRSAGVRARAAWGAAAGVLAAAAHLTKAATPPLVAVFVGVVVASELGAFWRLRDGARLVGRLGAGLLVAAAYLAVLSPYLANSRRVHGQYFYNLNTSLLVWYDNYPQASVAILSYGPDGWPAGAQEARPGPLRYWREHSVAEIFARIGRGFVDMAVRSYRTFWHLKFVLIYAVLAAATAASSWRAFASALRRNGALAAFLALYAVVYLTSIAFYEPTSGTGTTRFLLAHLGPFLFACSAFWSAEPFRSVRWRVWGLELTLVHAQWFVLATLALDIAFAVWPRLTTTYGGF